MPLCASDAAIISLDAMTGDLAIAADRRTARIPAGWSIRRLTAALWAQGLALANQGDVDPQSLAGAMATGTHGTGAALGSLATFARGFRSEEHTSELQSLMRLSYAVFCLIKKITHYQESVHYQDQHITMST